MSEPKKKQKAKPSVPLKDRLASKLGISNDIVSGGLIELRGRCEMTVGGCRKIEKYSDKEIILRLSDCSAAIRGKKLSCVAYFADTVGINGYINSVMFTNTEDYHSVSEGEKASESSGSKES